MSQKRTYAQTFGNSRSKTVHSTQAGLLPAQKILRNAQSKQVRKENIIANNQSSKLKNPYFNQIQSKSRILQLQLFAQFESVFQSFTGYQLLAKRQSRFKQHHFSNQRMDGHLVMKTMRHNASRLSPSSMALIIQPRRNTLPKKLSLRPASMITSSHSLRKMIKPSQTTA